MDTPDNRILGQKYRLVRLLDEGGMGAVWLAEHLSLHSPVAVKLLTVQLGDSEEGVQRFLREARAAASLRSPHVVQILDYGVDDAVPYIVMELLDGESLAGRLERLGRLSPSETDLVLRHVARAVARAHDAGIVHRDLKPANIYIIRNEDEELVKLLDFGIAKAAIDALGSSIANNTRTGAFLGTPFYVSPEQAEGVKTLDHRTDIWSMGVIAFECLIGRQPFAGETFGSLVLAICSRPMPVPSAHGWVPPGFDEWFARACARDVEQRFQSVRVAAAALRQVLVPEAADVAPPTQFSEGAPARAVGAEPATPPLEPPAPLQPLSSSPPNLGVTTGVVSSSATTRRRPPRSRARTLAAAGLGALLLLVAVVRWGNGGAAPSVQEASTASLPVQAALLAPVAEPQRREPPPPPPPAVAEPERPRVTVSSGSSASGEPALPERAGPIIAPVRSPPAAEEQAETPETAKPTSNTPRSPKPAARQRVPATPSKLAAPSKLTKPPEVRPAPSALPTKPTPATVPPAAKPAGKHGVNLGI